MIKTVTMYRPTGPEELELVKGSNYRRWPSRPPDQPIFYPVTNEQYAKDIAIKWSIPSRGVGYVTRSEVKKLFTARYIIEKCVVPTTPHGGEDSAKR